MKLPWIFEGPSLRRMSPDESVLSGFWSRVKLNGSSMPVAKENATLMPALENGQLVIYCFGGSPMITGQFNFEIFKINPQAQQWSKVNYERPIVQTFGSRPVYQLDNNRQDYKLYYFSGQIPLQRINEGVKVCPPDTNCLDSRRMKFSRIKKSQASMQVIGRKNFAISICNEQIFVTGGMDNGQNLLSEFLVLKPEQALWEELKQKRNKKNSMPIRKRSN